MAIAGIEVPKGSFSTVTHAVQTFRRARRIELLGTARGRDGGRS
jgi:hypothetical protein